MSLLIEGSEKAFNREWSRNISKGDFFTILTNNIKIDGDPINELKAKLDKFFLRVDLKVNQSAHLYFSFHYEARPTALRVQDFPSLKNENFSFLSHLPREKN